MIRIEITKAVWQGTEGGTYSVEPIAQDGVQHVEQRQILLVQEFEDLDIKPIMAYLNGLQTPSVCSCGHPKHTGRCSKMLESRMGYSTERCECADYMTAQEKAYLTEIKKSHKVIEELEIARSTHRSVAHERKETIDDLKGQLVSVTRSRNNLLRRSRKSGAKRR